MELARGSRRKRGTMRIWCQRNSEESVWGNSRPEGQIEASSSKRRGKGRLKDGRGRSKSRRPSRVSSRSWRCRRRWKVAGGQMGKEPGGQWHWIKRGLQEVFGINSFLFLIFVLCNWCFLPWSIKLGLNNFVTLFYKEPTFALVIFLTGLSVFSILISILLSSYCLSWVCFFFVFVI